MAKNIDNLTVTISVENAEEALVKAMDISKDKLEGEVIEHYYDLLQDEV